MTLARSPILNGSSIYLQPKNLADYLSNQQAYCLFLDIDGTLADFTLNPKDSVISNTTLTLLQRIQNQGVNIAIVTGRSLAEAKQMLFPIQLPIAATHGLEIALDDAKNKDSDSGGNNKNNNIVQVDTSELAAIREAITQSCLLYGDFTIEDKPYSVALHYRKNPALADVAYTIMSKALKNYSDWILKEGKYVWEIVPKGTNKGTAILTLLENMQTGDKLCPIFIGDDITDEAGFAAIQDGDSVIENNRPADEHQKLVKGMGIKVGSEPTCAHYYVHDIQEVTVLLDNFLTFYQERAPLSSGLADTFSLPLPKKMRPTI
ncbi:trehalose-phosphatase [Psychrobacter frigidicola]|uniref:Trehalose 6-phosphate phosphatase n=1 Tax=Psychrobacter frigidicola TaxID=45611 RepID=A0A5C7A4C4_9GAMM|nr:trehalose-phosphatase [Psychrobacter frigidicola]TXD98082.1 trehalose-phosphatase [Psychrobacter frigidicola]